MTALPSIDVRQIKKAHSIFEVAERLGIGWDQKKSVPRRRDWWACCPLHGENTPSFHVDDLKGFYHCFGCGAKGDAIGLVMAMLSVDFPAACKWIAGESSVPIDPTAVARRARELERQRAAAEREALRSKRAQRDAALEQWRQAKPNAKGLAAYLNARGVLIDPLKKAYGGTLPPTLRLARDVPYWQNIDGKMQVVFRSPCMLAPIRDFGGAVIGVHRTWLTDDCTAKHPMARRYSGAKKVAGWQEGGAIRLGAAARHMIVGEGIETVLTTVSHLAADGLFDPLQSDPDNNRWSAWTTVNLGNFAGPESKDWRHRGPINPEAPTGRSGRSNHLPSEYPDMDTPGIRFPDVVDELVWLRDRGGSAELHGRQLVKRGTRRHAHRPGLSDRLVRVADPPSGDFADWAKALQSEGKK